jgi:hydroxymethylbilane synthase
VRGNVETRLAKLERDEYDALLLAAAGLKRLGRLSATMRSLEVPAWLPAPGQGALGIEGRADDERVHGLLDAIEDQRARAETDCERSVLAALGGGCQVPIGALAVRKVRASTRGPVGDAVGLGRLLAAELRARGADELLVSGAHGAGA